MLAIDRRSRTLSSPSAAIGNHRSISRRPVVFPVPASATPSACGMSSIAVSLPLGQFQPRTQPRLSDIQPAQPVAMLRQRKEHDPLSLNPARSLSSFFDH